MSPSDERFLRRTGEAAGSGRPLGVTALAIFFGVGTIPSTATALALILPGPWSEAMWRLKPGAQQDFTQLGALAIPVMIVVAMACAAAAVGLWSRRRWGHRVAIAVLSVNLVGDLLNALVRGDRRTLIGLPIGGAMLVYLLTRRIREWFALREPA